MKRRFILALTVIFGLFWLAFGANGFLHFFTIPEPSGRQAANFMAALESTGYIMPVVYGTQILCGALLLTGLFVPLALLLLAPVTANILLYDFFLNPAGLTTGIIIGVIHAFLFFEHRAAFMRLFQPK